MRVERLTLDGGAGVVGAGPASVLTAAVRSCASLRGIGTYASEVGPGQSVTLRGGATISALVEAGPARGR